MTPSEVRERAQAALGCGYSAGEHSPLSGGHWAVDVLKNDEPDWLEFGFPQLTVDGSIGEVTWLSFKTGETMLSPFGAV